MSILYEHIEGRKHAADGVSPEIEGAKESEITRQAEGGVQFQIDGQYAIETAVFEGPYNALISAALDAPPGTYIPEASDDGMNIQGGVYSINIDRLEAGQGKATCVLYKFKDESLTTQELGFAQEYGTPSTGGAPFAQYYSLQNARYDIPIGRYLASDYTGATSLTVAPDAFIFSLWEDTEDENLKRQLKYIDPEDSSEYEIDQTSKTGLYIKKIIEGKESVLRFYPVVTRTSLWWGKCKPISDEPAIEPGADYQRLSYICAPKRYMALSPSWLKIQDDVEGEGPVLTRVECWMGSEKWDENLYGWGQDRWQWGSEAINESAEPSD